jgi:AraC-like DNA-binding protein
MKATKEAATRPRIKQAFRLSVSALSDALGYSSVSYFSRAFKSAFGQSPQQRLNASAPE